MTTKSFQNDFQVILKMMGSKLPMRRNIEPVLKMVTDLDMSDNIKEKPKKPHRHRQKKDLKQYSDNFPNRSKSAGDRNSTKPVIKDEVGYLKILIQTKDEQIEKLVQKIADLHNYNNQFATENDRLKSEISVLNENLQALGKNLLKLENKECRKCSGIEEIEMGWQHEKKELIQINISLKDDVEMMKTLVYRLNVQLERYQELIRKSSLDADDVDLVSRNTDSPIAGGIANVHWGSVNTHTLGPLLNAYQEMLREKDELIRQQEREINKFTGNLKEIIEENENLQQEMDDYRKGQDGWKEEKTRLQAQLEICRGKAEVQTRRADLAKEKLVEVLRCYEQKVQAQSLDLERLQEAYTRAKTELATLRSMNSQPETIVENLKECQKLFEELKSQHDNERSKISIELADFRKQNHDLEESIVKLREENSNLKKFTERQQEIQEEFKAKALSLKQNMYRLRESRDNLRSRLRTALQWAKKLEASREKVKNTWNNLRDLEAIIKSKEAQIRGLHARHLDEIGKLERRLQQKEETIKNILKEKAKTNI